MLVPRENCALSLITISALPKSFQLQSKAKLQHNGKCQHACQCSQTRMLQESKCVLSPFPLAMLIRLCTLQVHNGGTEDVYAFCLLLPIGITKETHTVNGRWCYLLEDDAVFQIHSVCWSKEGMGLLLSSVLSFYSYSPAVLASHKTYALLLHPVPWIGAGVAWEGQSYLYLDLHCYRKRAKTTLSSVTRSESTKKSELFICRLLKHFQFNF